MYNTTTIQPGHTSTKTTVLGACPMMQNVTNSIVIIKTKKKKNQVKTGTQEGKWLRGGELSCQKADIAKPSQAGYSTS